MEPRISILTLGVEDLNRSIEFYRDGLGLPMEERDEDESIAFFETSGPQLALYPREALAEDATVSPEGSGFSGVTIAHNVDSKEEVRAVLTEAEQAGATIVKPAQEVFWGGTRDTSRTLTAISGKWRGTRTLSPENPSSRFLTTLAPASASFRSPTHRLKLIADPYLQP